ncbi:MAG: uroporphyrinogen-III synthase [Gammaproteobacteria bacterium]|nr:uroporphyrinogen-III synthase [Gammaproteobacteria bacterium]MXX95413.1 uroporphyrinogen-III synthase [Gammaproteobacteria bacterium]MYF53826.1 uroporphyrinogen-III synthase [Gammaproteobacteria bacterium]MYK42767.1 uroporphyrinogen-III synthase [Gammaproteobacteria bacterium]
MKTIWITRTIPGAFRLGELLRQHGFDVLIAPIFDIVPLSQPVPTTSTNLWMFLSVHAVEHSIEYSWDRSKPCIGIGTSTTLALQQRGVKAEQPQCASSEGLFEFVCKQYRPPLTITLVTGKSGREDLAQWLREEGFQVQYWYVYERRLQPHPNFKNMIDTIVVLNAACLGPVRSAMTSQPQHFCLPIKLVVPSERIATQARLQGFEFVELSTDAADVSVLQALQRLS